MQFIVLAAIIPDAQEENVIKIAKEAGAGSVTILHGKNIGLKEKKVFFGLTLEENVSVLLFILPKRVSTVIFKKLKHELDMDSKENRNGMLFTFPLTHLAGLDVDEIDFFEEEIKNEL
ncbi:MAG: transcriptional regulator [Sulfurospirillaceae bacterium]|nr:transcriptional regulator [Sulfurospirillaceae bacterium]